METVVIVLLAAAVTYATCWAAGRLLARALRADLDHFLTFVSGASAVSTLVFFLTACGLARAAVFLALAGAILGVVAATGRIRRPSLPRFDLGLPRGWAALFWVVYLAYGWLYLSQALAPETSSDGMAYHVGLVAQYLREGRFPRITTNFVASFPEGIEMLFLLAFSMGQHAAAAMVEFLFLALTPFGILSWARRRGHPVAGVVGALLFYVSPVVGRDGTVAYVDVATAAIAFALFRVFEEWRERPSARLLALAGLLAGFGLAAKYTQAVGILYGVGLVVFCLWRHWKELLKSAAVFGLGAFLVAGPWLVKNAIVVDNPVSPFLNRVFPNRYVYPSMETEFAARNIQQFGIAARNLPPELAMGGTFEGLTGPVFLLVPLALVALGRRDGRRLLLAAAVYLAPCVAHRSARMLIPALVFVAPALALAIERRRVAAAVLLAVHAATCWPEIVALYAHPHAWRIEGENWAAALRLTPEEEYLRGEVREYPMCRVLDERVPPGRPVLSATLANRAYHARELINPYQSAFGTRLGAALNQATDENVRPTRRFVFRFPQRSLERLRLALTGCGNELWAVSEVRILRGAEAAARTPAWHVRAQPNPWDVELAFDGNAVTLWNAREYRPREAFIEIDFGAPERVDGLTADVPAALLGWCRMRLEHRTAGGKWEPLPALWTVEEAPYPADYRRRIAAYLKSSGIAWMVVRDEEALAPDLLRNAGAWGATPIAARRGYRLWRIE